VEALCYLEEPGYSLESKERLEESNPKLIYITDEMGIQGVMECWARCRPYRLKAELEGFINRCTTHLQTGSIEEQVTATETIMQVFARTYCPPPS
jgi:hypothetical protein